MKAVAEVIGVSRSNLIERLQGRPKKRLGRPPLPDEGGHRRVADLRLSAGPRHPQETGFGRWSQAAQSQTGLPRDEGLRPGSVQIFRTFDQATASVCVTCG